MHKNGEQVVGLAILFLVLSFIAKDTAKGHLLVIVSIVFLMSLLLKLDFVFRIANLWHSFFLWIMTTLSGVFLIIIFYAFITPYSFLYRVIQNKTIREYWRGPLDTSSYYTMNKKYSKESFEKPW